MKILKNKKTNEIIRVKDIEAKKLLRLDEWEVTNKKYYTPKIDKKIIKAEKVVKNGTRKKSKTKKK